MPKRAEGADTAHSQHVTDHPFMPRDGAQPWGLCTCGLSEAAHRDTVQSYEARLNAARKDSRTHG